MGRTLKHYSEHIDKLKMYAEACQIEVHYQEIDSEGIYLPSKRLIRIDPDLDDSTEIATFLHELGHSDDDSFIDPVKFKRIDKAYTRFYKNKANSEDVRLVRECEARAWTCGRAIAKKLRIRLGKWYTDEETSALAEYKEEVHEPS